MKSLGELGMFKRARRRGAGRRRLCRARRARAFALAVFCALAIALPGCGSTGSGSTGPGNVVVIIQPTSATLFLGQTQQFQGSANGAADTTVRWLVNGVAGGNASSGTITAGGLYTAPGILPAPAGVSVTAVSNANPQVSASATVNLQDDIVVTVSPTPISVATGGGQVFNASIAATGNPVTSVTWSVNGISSGNSTLGTIVANGPSSALYTAPAVVPSPPTVSVTATSAADASKSGSASVTITCTGPNALAPGVASVGLGLTQSFAATFCLAAGASIAWDVNGIAGGSASVGTIAASSAITALYTAPADLPSPAAVTIHATASAITGGGPASVAATVTLISSVSVTVAPGATSLGVNLRTTFTPMVTNTPDTAVTWLVNGTPNGSASVGQVCQTGSNPCVAPAGPNSGAIDYIAPASAPATNPVTLTAVSHADPSQSGFAMILITGASGPLTVTISPAFALVSPSTGTLSTFQFFANVTGTSNTSVAWSVASGVAGQGCGGAACGSVSAGGLYSAPTAAPSPNSISVTATSQADSTKSASATIVIASGPLIDVILPSSVMAGAVESFPLEVQGRNFVAGSGSAASVILVNGTARGTTCATATSCVTALNPADVQSAATLTLQVQNPGAPGALSNPVPFVIVPFDISQDVIGLSASQPAASSKDIVVVDPTTAAASAAIDLDFVGFLTGGNTCGVQGSPLTVVRPASGTTTVSLCVHGNGLDPTFTYAFTGPNGGDIGVTASAVTGLFSNTIELDLQISSTTLAGVRTLFITTLNNDRAAATGMLEVQ